MKKVMAFGVFDGVHEGHRHFLRAAKELGDYLIVAIAQDHIVELLKGTLPSLKLDERLDHLQAEDGVNEVVIGDHALSAWEVVKKHRPNIVAIGYDQKLLKEDLEAHLNEFNWPFEIKSIPAYELDA